MVKNVNNESEIVELWQEAFGDTKDDIIFFLNNLRNGKCIGIYNETELASMLFLVKCNFGNYIYAACTKKKYRGDGCMTKLLDYAKKSEKTLCLIPGDDSLVKFYKMRGFNDTACIDELRFDESDEIAEYLLDGYDLTVPQVMIYKEV